MPLFLPTQMINNITLGYLYEIIGALRDLVDRLSQIILDILLK
jgi:hypothetical protein